MDQSRSARGYSPTRRSVSLFAVALTALTFTAACEDSDAVQGRGGAESGAEGGSLVGNGGANGGASAGVAGTVDRAGSGGMISEAAGAAGDAGDAGAAGESGAGGAGAAGAAGEPGQLSNCLEGGAPLVVGNYVDHAGNQFLLRSAAKASTFAWVPAGPADPAKPPRLYVVNRVCAGGAGLLASDEHSNYRVDFVQKGSQLAVCMSAPVATLEAASVLLMADASRAADTGCAGAPFTVYIAEAL